MADHLTKRDGRYLYRRRFPAELVPVMGRQEFKKALGTSNRQEALRLARQVSVEFDRMCAAATGAHATCADSTGDTLHQGPGEPPGSDSSLEAGQPQEGTAEALLGRLHAFVALCRRRAIEALHPEGRTAATWHAEMAMLKQQLRSVAKGEQPFTALASYNPLEAKAGLHALQELARGDLSGLPGGHQPVESLPTPVRTTAAEFDRALSAHLSSKREKPRRELQKLCAKALRWPATQAEQTEHLMQYTEQRLAEGIKPSTAALELKRCRAVLRYLAGWEGFKLPDPRRHSTMQKLRGSGPSRHDRPPVPLEHLRTLIADMQRTAEPERAAAVLLLARYGMRPSELMREGLAALTEHQDILGNKTPIFQVARSGGKTAASRRDLPLHPEDIPLFKQVLVRCKGTADDADRRVSALSRQVSNLLPDGFTLYSIRHSAADLLRACGASDPEVGAILGHAPTKTMTAIYGGAAPLDKQRELLDRLRELIDTGRAPAAPPALPG